MKHLLYGESVKTAILNKSQVRVRYFKSSLILSKQSSTFNDSVECFSEDQLRRSGLGA